MRVGGLQNNSTKWFSVSSETVSISCRVSQKYHLIDAQDVYENLQVKQILERHLVIADQAYTMNELKEMSHLSGYLNLRLPTSRDVLTVSVTESSDRSK